MKKNRNNILIIAITTIIVMIPLIIETNSLGHDTLFHAANIESIKLDIINWSLPNRISTVVGNNLGYGTHLFYPMMPHTITAYIYSILSLFKFNVFDSMTLAYTIITFISAVEIYFLSQKLTKNKKLSLLSSIIFLYMPYRLGDIIVRSAFNEVFTFLFIPLVLHGLIYFIEKNDKKFYLTFIIGCVGLLYSHLVITLYLMILCIPFIILYRKHFFKKERLKTLITACIIIILLSLPSIIPTLEHKFLSNYMVFEKDYMSNITYMETFCNRLKDYFIIKNDYSWDNPMYLNYLTIILVITSFVLFIKEKKKSKLEIFLWISTVLSFLIASNVFPWKLVPSFLYLIQFPWRMMTFLSITISLLAPLALERLSIKKWKKQLIIGCLIIIPCIEIPLLVKLSNDIYQADEVIYNNGMGHSKEYLPLNTYQNIEYFENRQQDVLILEGNGTIKELENNQEKIEFEVNSDSIELVIEFPRLYYLGYSLKRDNGEKIPLEESKYGFLQARILENDAYTLTYKGTILEKGSYIVAILTLGYTTYLIMNKKKETN